MRRTAWIACIGLGVGSAAAVAAIGAVGPWPAAPALGLRVNAESVGQVDLALVHRELVPQWSGTSGGMREVHFDRLRRALAPDPTLEALMVRIGALDADPGSGAELRLLVDAWNEVCRRSGQRWRLAADLRVGGPGAVVARTYEVLDDAPRITVADRTFPVELRRRLDDRSPVDAWLGQMHRPTEGVVVLVDRIEAFTLDTVWPLADPSLDAGLDPVARAFAPAVRERLAAAIGPEAAQVLRDTASDRRSMTRAAEAIAARRACGSGFYVGRLPWWGLSARDLEVMARHVEPSGSCPEVTTEEAADLAEGSSRLAGRADDLAPALERAVRWVVRSVMVHEGRHAYDADTLRGQRIPCRDCPADTTHVGALEGAAYLAGFADVSTGPLAMLQACAMSENAAQVPDRASMVAYLAGALIDGGCAAGPPPDLSERARALAERTFGDVGAVEVTDPIGRLLSEEGT